MGRAGVDPSHHMLMRHVKILTTYSCFGISPYSTYTVQSVNTPAVWEMVVVVGRCQGVVAVVIVGLFRRSALTVVPSVHGETLFSALRKRVGTPIVALLRARPFAATNDCHIIPPIDLLRRWFSGDGVHKQAYSLWQGKGPLACKEVCCS